MSENHKFDIGHISRSREGAHIEERNNRLSAFIKRRGELYAKLADEEAVSGTHAPIPLDNSVRDELMDVTFALHAMEETDNMYKEAKGLFGRELTKDEEIILLTTLDYACKRIMVRHMRKKAIDLPDLSKWEYLGYDLAGTTSMLPGDEDLFRRHDLVHIVLALKQGLLNDNSPVPTFMQSEAKFDTSEQAMIEEAFAILFTTAKDAQNPGYDNFIKEPNLIHTEAVRIFLSPETSPLMDNVVSDGASENHAEEVLGSIRAFIEKNNGLLENASLLTSLALASQGAALGEALQAEECEQLSESEKLAYVKEHLHFAQENINALITGEVSTDADSKYRDTIRITRDTYFATLKRVQADPSTPVFVEILLETLEPLYEKAKAQADRTFLRLTERSEV